MVKKTKIAKVSDIPNQTQPIVRHKGWLRYVLLFIIVAVYAYCWFGLPKPENNFVAEVRTTAEVAEIEQNITLSDVKSLSDNSADTAEKKWHLLGNSDFVRDHILSVPELETQPSIWQVLHTCHLLKLQPTIVYEEELPQKIEEPKPLIKKTPASSVKIAIVVDDMGASPKRTNDILNIKAPLTASFLTFAPQLDKQVAQSIAAGHEVMLHVPMQPQSNIYVSNDVLAVDMSEKQITERFKKMLEKIKNIKGINNHMGSRFTERADKLAPVMKILAEHNLFFLDSKTTPRSQVEKTAAKYGVRYAHRHVFLDNRDELEYILRQLANAEKVARANGYAIAIGHPKTQTGRALKIWLPTLKEKGIELVPLSTLIN